MNSFPCTEWCLHNIKFSLKCFGKPVQYACNCWRYTNRTSWILQFTLLSYERDIEFSYVLNCLLYVGGFESQYSLIIFARISLWGKEYPSIIIRVRTQFLIPNNPSTLSLHTHTQCTHAPIHLHTQTQNRFSNVHCISDSFARTEHPLAIYSISLQ
jgi:hypothetical protein